MCLYSVNKDAVQIHSTWFALLLPCKTQVFFFFSWLASFISHAEFYLLGHSMYLCYETPQWSGQTDVSIYSWCSKVTDNMVIFQNNYIFWTQLICKQNNLQSYFLLQTLYYHVFRWLHDKTLTFCNNVFGHKNYPIPLKPRVMACVCNIFQLWIFD